MSHLQVIGHAPGTKESVSSTSVNKLLFRADSLDSVGEKGETEEAYDTSVAEGYVCSMYVCIYVWACLWAQPLSMVRLDRFH